MLFESYSYEILYEQFCWIYLQGDIKLLLVTVNNRLKFEIEIVHDLSCHPVVTVILMSPITVLTYLWWDFFQSSGAVEHLDLHILLVSCAFFLIPFTWMMRALLALRLMNRQCVDWTAPGFVACYNLAQVIGGVGHHNLLIVPCKTL